MYICSLDKQLIVTVLLSLVKVLGDDRFFVVDPVSNVNVCPGFRTEGLPPAVWRGGESEALERLNKHLDKKVTEMLGLEVLYLKTTRLEAHHCVLHVT